jgi:hypothetical protein
MAYEKNGEGEIIAINCDGCLDDCFVPILDPGDEKEEGIAWDQAEEIGWRKLIESERTVLLICPKCAKEEQI